MRKQFILLILLLFPINVFAYSDKLIVTGQTIGIEIHSSGVYIVGSYDNSINTIFQKGDKITSINHQEVTSINDLNNIVKEKGKYQVEYVRNHKSKEAELNVIEDNNTLKTGLYIKDEVNGIGTLSYIDPETRIFASLGHEILESSSNTLFELKNGYIYATEVKSIKKSEDNNIGEIHANFKNQVLGTVNGNKISGIYGKFQDDLDKNNLVEVGKKREIQKGKAYIRMNIENQKDYEINIMNISEEDPVKNIYFEIIDEELLQETGGVIQGMSGSPIIQNNKIIGVVNYVVVSDASKGYGIFIEKMLEEGDTLLKE